MNSGGGSENDVAFHPSLYNYKTFLVSEIGQFLIRFMIENPHTYCHYSAEQILK